MGRGQRGMCGLVGCVVKRSPVRDLVLRALQSLEYRGYDSAGVLFREFGSSAWQCYKTLNGVGALFDVVPDFPLSDYVALGHTRWAATGAVNLANAHPQFDSLGQLALVHNGILSNAALLRIQVLQLGRTLKGSTDTELLAILLAEYWSCENPLLAVQRLLQQAQGQMALFFVHDRHPNKLFIVRRGLPACVLRLANGWLAASDPMVNLTTQESLGQDEVRFVTWLPDCTFTVIDEYGPKAFDFDGMPVGLTEEELVRQAQQFYQLPVGRHYKNMMHREVMQIPAVLSHVANLVVPYSLELENKSFYESLCLLIDRLVDCRSLYVVACGSSYHAALLAKKWFTGLAVDLSVEVVIASEFDFVGRESSLQDFMILAISQSGETADVLKVVERAKGYGVQVFALTNHSWSSLARSSDHVLLMHAGVEVAVAATKSLLAQQFWLYYMACALSARQQKIVFNHELFSNLFVELSASLQKELFAWLFALDGVVNKLIHASKIIFLGKGVTCEVALEAALKLQELTYFWVHAWPAGELKHGPLALVDDKTVVILLLDQDVSKESSWRIVFQELKARGAWVAVCGWSGQEQLLAEGDWFIVLPSVKIGLEPFFMVPLIQLLAVLMAQGLGLPVDRPRHLAKSVTLQ